MTISKKEYYIIFLAFITLILLVIIFNWINYLSNNNYINYEKTGIEGFNSTYISDGHVSVSKTINNASLSTDLSCRNMCGPTAKCSITGGQCLSNMDCPGCKPTIPKPRPSKKYFPPPWTVFSYSPST
jgi:exopolysaccharide biosynthesis protein